MNRTGWDARRRNRNIGTGKSGLGQNNRLTISQPWMDDRLFYERLVSPVVQELSVNGATITILVEEPHPDFCHACTPEDIERVIKLLPRKHLEPIKLIVLRQPKKKEQILRSVWGRLQYWSDIEQYSGPAIHIDAQLRNGTLRWSKSLTPDYRLELQRLEQDGHRIKSDRRYYHITGNIESVRNTQLFRTLPHEVGHYADYLESVELPAGNNDEKWGQLRELYSSKPSKDKEDFAHRYATEFFELQKVKNELPFDKILDPKTMIENGLDPLWFSDADQRG